MPPSSLRRNVPMVSATVREWRPSRWRSAPEELARLPASTADANRRRMTTSAAGEPATARGIGEVAAGHAEVILDQADRSVDLTGRRQLRRPR